MQYTVIGHDSDEQDSVWIRHVDAKNADHAANVALYKIEGPGDYEVDFVFEGWINDARKREV